MFEQLSTKLSGLLGNLSRRTSLSEQAVNAILTEIRVALIEADVSITAAREIEKDLQSSLSTSNIYSSARPAELLHSAILEQLVKKLGGRTEHLHIPAESRQVVCLMGPAGVGKTTTAVKLAHFLAAKGLRPALVTTDYIRQAAYEQLTQLAEVSEMQNVSVLPPLPEKTIRKSPDKLRKHEFAKWDVLIVDTPAWSPNASELTHLPQFLSALKPEHTLLCIDSAMGQAASSTISNITEQMTITGALLTRMDSDAKGGVMLTVRHLLDVPIFGVGTGERPEDFTEFEPDLMARRLLGEGDIAGLLKEAQRVQDDRHEEKVKQSERNSKRSVKERGGLALLREQLRQINAMGGLDNVMRKMPSSLSSQVGNNPLGLDSASIVKLTAAIDSMTPLERERPKILNPSRRRRICSGAGVGIKEVNKLLKLHKQMSTATRKMKGAKKMLGKGLPSGVGDNALSESELFKKFSL